MADDDFDRLPADEKVARLRSALKAFLTFSANKAIR
jgi:hypothetical protein